MGFGESHWRTLENKRGRKEEKCGVTPKAQLKETTTERPKSERNTLVATGEPKARLKKQKQKPIVQKYAATPLFDGGFLPPHPLPNHFNLDCPVVSMVSWLPSGVSSLSLEAATILSTRA